MAYWNQLEKIPKILRRGRMSEDIKFGLNDISVSDDLDISLDNETYQDQANPAPVAKGIYGFRALELDAARYRGGENKGQPIYQQGYPLLELRMVEVVEGLGEGKTRKVGLFQSVATKPFPREGKSVSQAGDFARAYGLPNFNGAGEMIRLLQEAVEGRQIFYSHLDWESGFDGELVKAANEQLGLLGADGKVLRREEMDDEQKKLNNIVQYRLARVQGMKNFPWDATRGRYSPVLHRENVTFKHPISGQEITIECAPRTLEARNIIPVYFGDMKFVPKADVEAGSVNIGPFRVAAPAAA
jgi:hypothetical protein